MIPLLREYNGNICEQNLMNRYEFYLMGKILLNLMKLTISYCGQGWPLLAISNAQGSLICTNSFKLNLFSLKVHLSKFQIKIHICIATGCFSVLIINTRSFSKKQCINSNIDKEYRKILRNTYFHCYRMFLSLHYQHDKLFFVQP